VARRSAAAGLRGGVRLLRVRPGACHVRRLLPAGAPARPAAPPNRHAAPSLAERRRARAQLLYWTFLAEALPAGGSEPGLDALYYSEMHEAGYFDAGDDLG